MKGSLRIGVVALVCLLAVSTISGDSFTGLGNFSDSAHGGSSEALGVSADGTVVVGMGDSMSTADDEQAFRWTREEGLVGLGYVGEGSDRSSRATGVSADGSVIVGFVQNDNNYPQGFRWTSEGGIQFLGDLEGGWDSSRAWDVSADGSVIVGDSSATFGDLGFTWTQSDGMVAIPNLPDGLANSLARGISADGSVVVGQAWGNLGNEAFRMVGNDMVGIGELAGGLYEAIGLAVSADGSTVVGYSLIGGSQLDREAFRWTAEEGMAGLGYIGGGDFKRSEALDVTADGKTVVGYTFASSEGFSSQAFIWDAVNGMRDLEVELKAIYGLDLGGRDLTKATGISDDGSVIVGVGSGINGLGIEAWVAEISPQSVTAPPTTTWIYSGPLKQNDVNSVGSPYPDIWLNDIMHGTFTVGQNGEDAENPEPGVYRFTKPWMKGSIAWENAVISSEPTSSPVTVSFRDNDTATATELGIINFYLGNNLPANTQFDIVVVESDASDGDMDREFGITFISRDLNFLTGTDYQPLPTPEQVDLAIFFLYDAYFEEPRFTGSGLVTEWRGPVDEITITDVQRAGNLLTIYFTSIAGVKSWELKGTNRLHLGLTHNLTGEPYVSFMESNAAPGNYSVEIDFTNLVVPPPNPPRYFFSIQD